MPDRPSPAVPTAHPPLRAVGGRVHPLPPTLHRGRAPRPRRRQTLLRAALRALLARPAESAHDAERAVARIMAHVRLLG
jgi:hypothetical protein